MTVISISLSTKEDRALTKLAKQTDRSKSQIVRAALRRQYELEAEFERQMVEGDKLGKKLGIKSDDDVQRIFGPVIRRIRHERLARGATA